MEKYTKDCGFSYSLGMSVTMELLKMHPQDVIEVYYSSRIYQNDFFNKLDLICKRNNIDLIEDDKLINKLSVKENCYVIAKFRKFQDEFKGTNRLVLCDMNDEGDFGTIIRTAVSFDVFDIALVNSSIDYFEPRVIRSSMGALFHTNIKEYRNINEYLKDNDLVLYQYKKDSDIDIHNLEIKKPCAFIISDKDIKANYYKIIQKRDLELSKSLICAISLSTLYAKD